jgi:RNA polymerase sigma factor (TIGR02999 family)
MLPAPQEPQPPNGTFESLYAALRAQARHYLRREQNAYSLSPTMLVHEAWMALARSQGRGTADRDHYFHLVSRVMKNLLVDHARRKRATMHGGGAHHVEWSAAPLAHHEDYDLVLAVGDAMERLAAASPRLAALVEMRYFGGFSEAEVAQILGVSIRTVRRQWAVARLRLLELLQSSGTEIPAYV